MSRYSVNKVLYNVYADPTALAAFTTDPEAFLADQQLNEAEQSALAAADVRALMDGGAHPFLIFNFALALHGGFTFEFCGEYVGKLQGLTVGDITT